MIISKKLDTNWCPIFLCDKANERKSSNHQNAADNNELTVHIAPLKHFDVFVIEMIPDQFFEETQFLVSVKIVSHKIPPKVNTLPTGDELHANILWVYYITF